MSAPKKTRDDLPSRLEVEEIAKEHEHIQIRVRRYNDKGVPAILYNGVRMPPMDLLTLDAWLNDMAGGGRFRIEVFSVDHEPIFDPITITIEGPPKAHRKLLNVPAVFSAGGTQYTDPPSVGEPTTRWEAGLTPQNQEYYRMSQQQSSPDRNLAPESHIVLAENRKLEAEKAKLEERLEYERKERERIERMFNEKMRSIEEEMRESRHRQEMEMLKREMELMRKQAEQPAQSRLMAPEMLTAIAGIASAVVPLFQTQISANKEAQARALELQQQGFANLMNAANAALQQTQSKKDETSELLKVALPVIAPIIQKMMDDRGPMAQHKLFEAMTNNSLNTISLMTALVSEMAAANAGPDEPIWAKVVREMLSGVQDLAGNFAMAQRQAAIESQQLASTTARAITQGFSQSDAVVQMPATGMASVPHVDAPAPQQRTVTPEEREHVMREIEKQLNLLPTAYRTEGWQRVLLAVHGDVPPEQVAHMLADHVIALLNGDLEGEQLPPEFARILDEPETTLRMVMKFLPIMRHNPTRAEAIIREAVAVFASVQQLPEENEGEVQPEIVQDGNVAH